jgi:hypothetical protein
MSAILDSPVHEIVISAEEASTACDLQPWEAFNWLERYLQRYYSRDAATAAIKLIIDAVNEPDQWVAVQLDSELKREAHQCMDSILGSELTLAVLLTACDAPREMTFEHGDRFGCALRTRVRSSALILAGDGIEGGTGG